MKKFIYLTISIINMAVSAVCVALLPNEIVPSHYNLQGVADAYYSKWTLMIIPCILILFSIIYMIYQAVSKKSKNFEENKKYVERGIFAIYLLLIAMCWIATIPNFTGMASLGNILPLCMLVFFGALMIFLSNMYPKIKQNSNFGIKTPATLSSETVWKKTHKLGGYLGVISGIFSIVLAIAGFIFNADGIIIFLTGIGVFLVFGVIVPVIYASVIRAKEKKCQ